MCVAVHADSVDGEQPLSDNDGARLVCERACGDGLENAARNVANAVPERAEGLGVARARQRKAKTKGKEQRAMRLIAKYSQSWLCRRVAVHL